MFISNFVEIWQTPQAEILERIRKVSAPGALTGCWAGRGKFWQEDYWDRYVRDEEHLQKIIHYIEWNPVKAGLVKSPEQWPFSSARYRDEYYRLKSSNA